MVEDKKREILEIEEELVGLDEQIDVQKNLMSDAYEENESVRVSFADHLKEQMDLNKQNKEFQKTIESLSCTFEDKIKQLQDQLRGLDTELQDAKAERQDLQQHVKAAKKIQKSGAGSKG